MSDARDPDAGTARNRDGNRTIGARLRAAREQGGLSVETVAKQLRLDAGIVNALENDDRQQLPATIFVQGYLRSYARLVGLPEDELAHDYTRQEGELPPLKVRGVRERQPFFKLPTVRLLRNVLVILLVLILLWLAYPHVQRIIDSRGEAPVAEDAPGHLELPPARR